MCVCRPVNAQGDEHEEEEDGPEEAARHRGDGVAVHDEHQALALHPHVAHVEALGGTTSIELATKLRGSFHNIRRRQRR